MYMRLIAGANYHPCIAVDVLLSAASLMYHFIFVEKIANNQVDPKSIYDMKEKLGSG